MCLSDTELHTSTAVYDTERSPTPQHAATTLRGKRSKRQHVRDCDVHLWGGFLQTWQPNALLSKLDVLYV